MLNRLSFRKRWRLSCLLASLALPAAAGPFPTNPADWFMTTPLQSVYQALVEDQTELAWQELQLTLQQHASVPVSQWQPVFQQILNQSDCGRRLGAPLSLADSTQTAMRISLSLQHKVNLHQQVQQLKVAIEGAGQSLTIVLTDRAGKPWLSGIVTPDKEGYAELESAEWFQPVPDGGYLLQVGKQTYPLILVSAWLPGSAAPVTFQDKRQTESPFLFPSPEVTPARRCQVSRRLWQWLDGTYQLAAPLEAVQLDNQRRGIIPASVPADAEWLSAVVASRYFQGSLDIEQVYRVTLPVRYLHVSRP
ncbi:DUF2861 family protein [Photobacterium sp. R1]